MSAEEALQHLIETLMKRVPVSVSVGTVKSVDKQKRTCTVERDERPTLFNVRLNSIISDYADHCTVFPKIGSYVLCIVIGNQTDCFLLAISEPEEISLKIGESELTANANGWAFNGGKNKGMVKVEEMVEWMSGVQQDLQTLQTQLSTHPTAGNGAALGLVFNPTTKTPKVETFANEKITQ